MFRQVHKFDNSLEYWIKGIIIRLLILPNNISGTKKTLEYISNNLSKDIAISIMSQYYPTYKAPCYEGLSRKINLLEYSNVKDTLDSLGFQEGWIQPFEADFNPKLAGESFKSNI